MRKSSYQLLLLVAMLGLFPAYSSAVIEEKSSVVGNLASFSNEPISGVKVKLLDSFFLTEVASAITDGTGKFTIPNLLPGLYLLSVDSPQASNIFKRIQVVSGAPTLIDLKPMLSEKGLQQHSAWDKFKWTIRVAQRNPLRDEHTADQAESLADTGSFWDALNALRNEKRVQASLAYLNVGATPASTAMSHQMARVALEGELNSVSDWSFNSHFMDGPRSSYSASGDFQYRLPGHEINASFGANDVLMATYPELLADRHISSFINSANIDPLAAENKTWVTSIQLADQWELHPQFKIGYGTRLDYHGYLHDPVSYSPRVEIAYEIAAPLTVRGVYYRNQTAPGNYYFHSQDVHSYIQNVAFVPYTASLNSETTTGVEAGVDYKLNTFSISMSIYQENILDKIAAVDISNSPVNQQLQAMRPFVIFNARDLNSRGIDVHVTKQLSSVFTAIGTYQIKEAVPVYIVEKRKGSEREMFFVNGRHFEKYHDVQAGIQAVHPDTETEFHANWKWSSGSPLSFGRKKEALAALDFEVHQGLPVFLFPHGQLSLLVAVKNVLDQTPDKNANADFQRAMLFGMPRLVAGGVLVKF